MATMRAPPQPSQQPLPSQSPPFDGPRRAAGRAAVPRRRAPRIGPGASAVGGLDRVATMKAPPPHLAQPRSQPPPFLLAAPRRPPHTLHLPSFAAPAQVIGGAGGNGDREGKGRKGMVRGRRERGRGVRGCVTGRRFGPRENGRAAHVVWRVRLMSG